MSLRCLLSSGWMKCTRRAAVFTWPHVISCFDRAHGRRVRAPHYQRFVPQYGVHLLIVWCFDDVRLGTKTAHLLTDN